MTNTHQQRDNQSLSLEEALARQSNDDTIIDVDEPCQQLVLFRLAEQRFALPGSAVNEILNGDQPVYFVPGLPASTEGVIHLRGNIESVVTLQALLGLPFGTNGHAVSRDRCGHSQCRSYRLFRGCLRHPDQRTETGTGHPRQPTNALCERPLAT